MRIVYLHQYFVTPSMSGGTRSYELARRLVQHGHEVHMVTSDTTPARGARGWRESEEAGIRVHWLPVAYSNAMGYAQRLRAFGRFAARAGPRALALHGDVVFATSTPLTIAVPGLLAAGLGRVPMVFEVRDLWPALPVAIGALRSRGAILAARALERAAYAHAAHVVALSPGMRDGVVAAGVPPGKVSVIPNLCDVERFGVPAARGEAFRARHAWLGARPLVVYAGTLGRANGVDFLVRLAAAVRGLDREVRFLVVGHGSEEGALHALADALGVRGRNLFFLPPVPKAEMPDVLSAATLATSLFAPVPGLEDNSANKFFDALAAGRPVALDYGGWQAELVASEGVGLRLDPADPEGAARQVAARVRDAAWLAGAGARAARLGAERFSADAAARALADVLARAARPVPARRHLPQRARTA